MIYRLIAVIFLVLTGWVASEMYHYYQDTPVAQGSTFVSAQPQLSNVVDAAPKDVVVVIEKEQDTLRERPSPKSRVTPQQILVYDKEVILKIENPQWAVFTDTNSMDPVIDSESKAIQIVPQSSEDIGVGDIVAYVSKYKEGVIAHRVVEIDYDAFGWYARVKGDNNPYMDPGKVRFDQIKRVVVGIIY